MNIPSSTTYAWWLSVLRIYTGAFWILYALPKFTNPNGFLPPNGSMATMIGQAASSTTGPYHAFIIGTVQPHIALFAQLERFGELGVGILLLLGLFTRLGGLLGALLAANYLLAAAQPPAGALVSLNAVALALSAVHFVLPTGRFFGVDAMWGRRRYSVLDDTPAMPIPPRRPAAQPAVSDNGSTVVATQGTIPAPEPAITPAPGPNGANGGPEFAAPASAGPQVDQSSTQGSV